MQEGGSGQCSSGSPTVSIQKEEKEEKKKKRHFIHSFATCWKDGKAFERVTKHKRKAGRRQYGAEEECDRIVKYTM